MRTSAVVLFSAVLLAAECAAGDVVSFHTAKPVNVVPDTYVSVTLDASEFEADRAFDAVRPFDDPKLLALSQGLSPAVLRVSGTEADYLYYEFAGDNTSAVGSTDPGPRPVQPVNRSVFDGLAGFAKSSGWDMVFGVSILNRTQDNQWRPESVRGFLEYAKQQGIVVGYELGNEPDLDDSHNKTHFLINPDTVASSFASFIDLLGDVYYGPGQGPPGTANASAARPLLAGCDVADDISFLSSFGQALAKQRPGQRSLSTLTWHHYYGAGPKMTVADFLKPEVLDKVRTPVQQAQAAAEAMPGGLAETAVWIGETGSSYGGGTPGVSDRFVSIFWWLDQLGYAAVHGHTGVCRQCFIGGAYTLVDPQPSLFPNSDYWAAVLHKQLVGGGQLAVDGQDQSGLSLRAYAACTRRKGTVDARRVAGARDYPAGSVTVVLLNVRSDATNVTLQGSAQREAPSPVVGASSWQLFQLTAPGGNVSSKSLQLNGKVLATGPDGSLPALESVSLPSGQPVSLPPYSASFVVVTDAGAPACT